MFDWQQAWLELNTYNTGAGETSYEHKYTFKDDVTN